MTRPQIKGNRRPPRHHDADDSHQDQNEPKVQTIVAPVGKSSISDK